MSPAPEVLATTEGSKSNLTLICGWILRLSRERQFAAWLRHRIGNLQGQGLRLWPYRRFISNRRRPVESTPMGRAITDAQGTFVLKGMPASEYVLRVHQMVGGVKDDLEPWYGEVWYGGTSGPTGAKRIELKVAEQSTGRLKLLCIRNSDIV